MTANTQTPKNNAPNAPIGLFDSGVGGLSVYVHLQARLPYENFLYYADTKNVPYGNKNSDEIAILTEQAVDWLVWHGAKLVVVACNSASAHALERLRQKHSIPIVGLVPAIKPATFLTQTGKVAVLATQATLMGKSLNTLIHTLATPKNITVFKHFEPKLVPWVEMGAPTQHEVADLLIQQIHTWFHDGVDVIVLGCTHYPFFRPLLQAEIDRAKLGITLIDSGLAIANRVAFLLNENTAPSKNTHSPLRLYNSAHQNLIDIITRLIDLPIVLVDYYNQTDNAHHH